MAQRFMGNINDMYREDMIMEEQREMMRGAMAQQGGLGCGAGIGLAGLASQAPVQQEAPVVNLTLLLEDVE